MSIFLTNQILVLQKRIDALEARLEALEQPPKPRRVRPPRQEVINVEAQQ